MILPKWRWPISRRTGGHVDRPMRCSGSVSRMSGREERRNIRTIPHFSSSIKHIGHTNGCGDSLSLLERIDTTQRRVSMGVRWQCCTQYFLRVGYHCNNLILCPPASGLAYSVISTSCVAQRCDSISTDLIRYGSICSVRWLER